MKAVCDIYANDLKKFAEEGAYYKTAKILNEFCYAVQKKYESTEDYVGIKRQINVNLDLIMEKTYYSTPSVWEMLTDIEHNPTSFISMAKEYGIEIEH